MSQDAIPDVSKSTVRWTSRDAGKYHPADAHAPQNRRQVDDWGHSDDSAPMDLGVPGASTSVNFMRWASEKEKKIW